MKITTTNRSSQAGRNCFTIFSFFLCTLLYSVSNVHSQALSNYGFAASTGTYTALSGSTFPTMSNADDGLVNGIPINFDFWYMGEKYSTVGINTNGYVSFGTADSDLSNNLGYSGGRPLLAPLWDDLHAVTTNANISYLTQGSAPNRTFTVEFNDMLWDYEAGGAVIDFQVILSESSGKVEFVYNQNGTAYSAGSGGASIGITASGTSTNNFMSLDGAGDNPSVSLSSETGDIEVRPASDQLYTFTPPTTTPPTALNFTGVTTTAMTLNWTNNGSNRVLSAIYRSTDDVTYTWIANAASGATSYAASGLAISTTYYWKVYAISEGYVSSALAGNQATAGTPTAYVWDGGGGDNVWTTAANWDADVAPVAASDVTFNTASTFTVTSVPTLALNSLTLSNGTVTLSGSTTTLTVGGIAGTDLTIASTKGITLNGVSITLANSATADISGVLTITAGTYDTDGTSVITTVASTGSIVNSGTVTCTSTAKLIFEGTSSYTHALNGGTIPTADWNGASNTATSTCQVTGMTSTKPEGLITSANTFYHLTWNCASQAANLLNESAGALTVGGENMTCLGNFTITNCNGHTISFSEDDASLASTLTVGGDMTVDDGDFYFNWWYTFVTVDITGDLNIDGGDVYGFNWTAGDATVINIGGDVNLASGWLTGSGSDYSNVTFNITNDLIVTGGGGFNGTWNGSASPTIEVGRDFLISGGASAAINTGTGSPTLHVTRNLQVTGGSFVGNEGAGTPNINIDGDVLTSTAGSFYGASGSGNPIFNIFGTMTVAAGGTYYGSDDTGAPTFNITQDLVSSGGWGTGSYSSGVATYNITRDLIVSGGTFYADYSGGANSIFTITRNVNVSSGWLILSYDAAAPQMIVTGDVTVSGGNLYLSYGTGAAVLTAANLEVSGGWCAMTEAAAASSDLNITGNLTVSGGDFSGSESGSACSPTIDVTGNVNISSGNFFGAYYSGTPTYTIGGNLNQTGGFFYGTDGLGAPQFIITGDLLVSDGIFRGSFDAGSPTYDITGNISVSGGTFYGIDWSGGATFDVGGNLTVSGTGIFSACNDAGDPVYNITGNVSVSGGATTFYGSSYDVTGNPIFNIDGSVDLSTGTVAATDGSPTSTSSVCTFNLTGAASNTLKLKTGLSYDEGCPWSWNISAGRTISLQSNIEIGGTGSSCIFTNNGTLIMGTYTFPEVTTAVSSFVNASGATLKTAHLTGLSTTAATGSIQLTGTKTFSSAASYVFNGGAAQETGNFGASTTPTASTVANLEFDNSSGVSLTGSLTIANAGALTLTSGYHDLGAFTLQLGTSAANSLVNTAGGLYSSSDDGSFKRYIPAGAVSSSSGNYYGLFPFQKTATMLNKLELNSTADVTTGGLINATPGFSSVVTNVDDYADDHGTVQALKTGRPIDLTLTTLAGGTFNVTLTGGDFTDGVTSDYTLSTYTGSTASYIGTYAATIGTSVTPIVGRTDVATADLANTFVIGTYNFGVTTLPIELISFYGQKANKDNLLLWETLSEWNNDYFTIEKTTDGDTYETVGIKEAGGTSTQNIKYQLTDYNVREVINYYRLKQTDFDGKYTFSMIISIDNRTKVADKEITLITNLLGQQVNEFYRGIVLISYSDGTSAKVIQ
jgi:hypothetical protein